MLTFCVLGCLQHTFLNLAYVNSHNISVTPDGNRQGKPSNFFCPPPLRLERDVINVIPKRVQPYQKTPKSTFEAGRVQLQKTCVSSAVEAVSEDLGGILFASRAADLPTRKQFSALTCRIPEPFKSTNRGPPPVDQETAIAALVTDPNSMAVARAHSQNPDQGKKGRTRMRVFCMSEDMKADFQRICVGRGNTKRHVSVDTTFNMGTFFLTLLSSRDPMFVIPKYNTERIVVVAALFHGDRESSDFKYFAEQLTEFSGCRLGDEIRGWTSDGDPALIKGLKEGSFLFANSPHIRCERHLQENIKRKLKELGVAGKDDKDLRFFIEDIFGSERDDPLTRGTKIRIGGLVDLSKENFRVIYPMKKAIWDVKEQEITGKDPKFFNWFQRYKVPEIEESYLPEIRDQITNNGPAGRITNNDSEILNLMAQQNQRSLKLPLDKAIQKLQQFVSRLIKVRQNALFSLDDETASVTPDFLVFKRSKLDFDKMDPRERTAHLQKVFPFSVLVDSATSGGTNEVNMSIGCAESNLKFFSQ